MNSKIKKLVDLMKEKELDATVIVTRPNTVYFSGFTGTESIIIVTREMAVFSTDFRYIERVIAECSADFTVEKAEGSQDDYIIDKIKSLGAKRLGFEDSLISYSRCKMWMSELKDVEFIGIQNDINKIRQIKDSDELKKIQRAVDIADDAFSHILKFLKPGVCELDIAAEIEYFMKKNGATSPSFVTIAVSGVRTSMPHGTPSSKLVETGDPVTMDFGALVDGYCSDMTRTVFVGTPTDKMWEIYNIVLKAQINSQEFAVAGRTGQEIDAVSREIIYGAGYEGYYGHNLGHSVGTEIHENPRFSTKSTTIMENGMVMTVEPGIYVPDIGGVRIENMIVINGDKPINMTKSTKELIIL